MGARRQARVEARRERRSARKEKRQVRRAVRRDKLWGAADAWWTLRNDIANDPKAKKKVRRVAGTLNPVAGLIAAAALEVDRVVAPTVLDFIDEKKGISRAILQEMVDQGRISEAQAGILAAQVDDILDGKPATPPFRTPAPAPVASHPPAPGPSYWPWVVALGAFFILRGS